MKDKGIAHIGIGEGKGDNKALDAVKMAVESPLLETTITGATDVIINISGDISLADASDAADYVQQLSGEEVNIIFGAMYDETKSGCCMITVIATGIEDAANIPNRVGGGFTYKAPTASNFKNMGTPVVSSVKVPTADIPAAPIQGINKPVDIRSNVQGKALKIPDFLQRK
jgi:cell division protein FtsZ